jgi:hypothetical protein
MGFVINKEVIPMIIIPEGRCINIAFFVAQPLLFIGCPTKMYGITANKKKSDPIIIKINAKEVSTLISSLVNVFKIIMKIRVTKINLFLINWDYQNGKNQMMNSSIKMNVLLFIHFVVISK